MASLQEVLAREFQQYGGSVSGKGTAGSDFRNPSFADGWNKKKEVSSRMAMQEAHSVLTNILIG